MRDIMGIPLRRRISLTKTSATYIIHQTIVIPVINQKNIRKPRNNSGAFFIGTQKEGIY